MKTLIIVRHANALSGWEARVNTDAERPLSPEGIQKAAQTAQALKARAIAPDIILTSPLLRAVQTADTISQTIGGQISKETVLNGLHADREVCEFLANQMQEHNTVIAVGHNPSVAYVLHLFCKEIHHFAPGSFAVLNFENPHHPQLTYFGE